MSVNQIFKIYLVPLLLLNQININAAKFAQHATSENKIENDTIPKNSEFKKFTEYRAQYARKMISLMNHTVDPCDDFYEYACGNYKNVYVQRQTQVIPPDRLTDIDYEFSDLIEQILHKPPPTHFAMEYAAEFRMANQFYNTCLTADLYPIKKSQIYLEVLKSIGGFPAADNTWHATAYNFSWLIMSAHLSNFGASGLIKEKFGSYPYALNLTIPELGFDYKIKYDFTNPINSGANAVNEKRMRQLLLAYKLETVNATQIIVDIYELWESILNIDATFSTDSDEIQDNCRNQWKIYYAIGWNGRNMNFVNEKFCHFYIQLNKICEDHKEAVANYLSLQFLHHMYARLDDKKYQKESCLIQLRRGFPFLFDKLYLAEHFNMDILDEIYTIITKVKQSLFTLIQVADFLDDYTRKEALLKESAIISRIYYKEESALKERLLREINNFKFVDYSFEHNNLELMKYRSFIKRYYTLHSSELNNATLPLELLIAMNAKAVYSSVENSVSIAPGILNPPIYHKAWPYSLKFAALGNLVGHELAHAFDTEGAQFDRYGFNERWLSDESYGILKQRAKCYIEHFNSYQVPEINRTINGDNTKDENIADSTGLRESLNAYRNYMKELRTTHGKTALTLDDEPMPGLEHSPEQLYFLGFAQVLCAAYKEEHYWLELDNEHTINKYRVLGALTNFDEFAKVYNCPLGSKMNPKSDKCRIW